MNLSFQKLFYAIATIFLLFATLVLARPILIPLGIALLISFILLPLAKKFEAMKIGRTLSAFLTILTVLLLLGGIIFFFSAQLINISKEFTHFKDKIILAFADVTLYFNNHVSFVKNLEKNEIFNRLQNWLNDSTGFLVRRTVSNTATFLTGLLVTIVFTFLFLIYRDGLTKAFLAFSPEDKRKSVLKMFKSVQHVGQQYLFGMTLLTIIIGTVNSIGLLVLGIDNPFLFGFLGASLAIIPYIGTIIGALIPVIYTFAFYGSIWMAVTVAILFLLIRLGSDNFLIPYILGGSLKINALIAILSSFIGAIVWGLAGIILFLPFVAMLKVVCENFNELKPIALIIDEQNKKEHVEIETFLVRWWENIKAWFSNNKS